MDKANLASARELETILYSKHLKCATAESCTGGLISAYLTAVPGSSNCFDRGFVTYTNEAKSELLHVDPQIINTYGAVSVETAKAMVSGALAHSHADLAAAVTGIAGPGGGSEQKPVGTVCFGLMKRGSHAVAVCRHFQGDRDQIREQSVREVLIMLKAAALGLKLSDYS